MSNSKRDEKTLNRFLSKPGKFLKEHNVNTMWGEDPSSANNQSSQNQTFFLVERQLGSNETRKQRPGRVLGNLRKHDVKDYYLTNNADTASGLGRTVGQFDAPHLAVRRTTDDTNPALNSALDTRRIEQGKTIHTMDLSGCTIKRNNANLHHVMPDQDGQTLQNHLGGHTYGKNQYGGGHRFVMMKRKSYGVKLYAQNSPDGIPSVTKHKL